MSLDKKRKVIKHCVGLFPALTYGLVTDDGQDENDITTVGCIESHEKDCTRKQGKREDMHRKNRIVDVIHGIKKEKWRCEGYLAKKQTMFAYVLWTRFALK